MPELALANLSLRSLRSVRAIADLGSLTAAAETLNRSQSALSKSLTELEQKLGVRLFDRNFHGVDTTAYGSLLVERIREAELQLELAARSHRSSLRTTPHQQHNPVFTLEISRKRIAAFLAVHELRHVGRAAERIGLTRAAVYDSLRTLEDLLEMPLFETTGSVLRSTPYADVLATHLSLAFSLIQHGMDEIASLDGAVRGRLVIGTLPYSRTVLVPRTIVRVLHDHPQLQIATREGPYDVLERALRSGNIDLIIGATRQHDEDSPLFAETLFEDELAVICGAHHPLASQSQISLDGLMQYPWVLPVPSTPARQLFDRFLERHGASEPRQVVETGSMSMTRSLLLESDSLALLSTHQVQLDQDAGLLATLPFRLEETYRPIGITQRAHSTPSPAARVFMAALRELVKKPYREPGTRKMAGKAD
jgi:LysR family transcriptional regulator of gallate degradation